MPCVLLIISFLLSFVSLTSSEENTHPLLIPGKCQGLWRPDNLLGKCFGLRDTMHFDDLKDVKITTSQECRAACCNLGDKCVSWQFLNSKSECKLGGVVRLGLEKNGKPDWCDPNPPIRWNGKRLLERKSDGECVWQDKVQANQCFGLGDARLNITEGALDTSSCQKACCDDKRCEIWQEHPARGCFFGRTTQCPKSYEAFEGQRKCIPGYCGGMENEILAKYERKQAQVKISISAG